MMGHHQVSSKEMTDNLLANKEGMMDHHLVSKEEKIIRQTKISMIKINKILRH